MTCLKSFCVYTYLAVDQTDTNFTCDIDVITNK